MSILPSKGNTRIGWSTVKGDVQAPVGYDEFSYSYRDKDGSKFHLSRGQSYGDSYGCGDIIGCYIHIPVGSQAKVTSEYFSSNSAAESNGNINGVTEQPEDKKDLPNEQSKQSGGEDKSALQDSIPLQPPDATIVEDVQSKDKKISAPPPKIPESKIIFFKNGVSQGVAFVDLTEGVYYPAGSFYLGAGATFNFGLPFKYPPPPELNARPIADIQYLLPHWPLQNPTPSLETPENTSEISKKKPKKTSQSKPNNTNLSDNANSGNNNEFVLASNSVVDVNNGVVESIK